MQMGYPLLTDLSGVEPFGLIEFGQFHPRGKI
jgi:hypothetical protein